MEAIRIEAKKAKILESRCIGCGLCVPACPKLAISLEKKEKTLVPPDTTEDLKASLARTRPSFPRKLAIGIKAVLGIKMKP
jgi:Na+-translocating ferredoxin:NAD+ oxidoreductase subunit B